MSNVPFHLSKRANHTGEQPISYFMQQAIENPGLISLAAGLVDPETLPAEEIRSALDEILSEPRSAQAALQYGTTQGYTPLREKILAHVLALDGVNAQDLSLGVDDVVVTTGSQQLLYVLGELLCDPGDIVITEAPSYFVYHSVLSSIGVRVLSVPMDEHGMITDALEEMLTRLDRAGDLHRVRLIYTVDYFQNPTGLSLSLPRRKHLLELARRFSKKQRVFVLEDAAYRELRYDGVDVPSIKSLDHDNQHVILTMTFSKPTAPGLKTGYGVMPRELVGPLARFKGNHDFGSSNLNQHILDRLMASGVYDRHVNRLRDVYRAKRDVLLEALAEEFPHNESAVRWTRPDGGLYVWLRCPGEVETGPGSRFMEAAIEQGVLYVPGAFCYVKEEDGRAPNHEARLCFATATAEQLREAVRRLGRAAREAMPSSIYDASVRGLSGLMESTVMEVAQFRTSVDFARPGKQQGHLSIPYSYNLAGWANLMVPITVVHGGAGPTALVLAGNHGDEYPGQVAILKLCREITAEQVAGRLILIPCLNMPASKSMTRLSPLDGKNFNRCFPGKADGAVSEMLAHYLSTILFPLADLVIDIHTGGRSTDFVPCAHMHLVPDREQRRQMVEGTEAWGSDLAFLYADIAGAGLLPVEAERQGKIVITTEMGGGEVVSAAVHRLTQSGLRNVLMHFGVLRGVVQPRAKPVRWVQALDREDYRFAPESGLYENLVDLGAVVAASQPVGQIHFVERPDREPVSVVAASAGVLIGTRGPSLVVQGDCVACIAHDVPSATLR